MTAVPTLNTRAAFVKTPTEWRALNARRSVKAAATAYARDHMVAVVMHADDSATLYLFDVANDRVAVVTHPRVEWVH